MTRLSLLLGGVALFALPVTAASADCREEIALLQGSDVTASISGGSSATGGPAEGTTTNFETGAGVDTSGEVSKDGSTAPLQTDDTANAGTTAPTGGAGAATATAGATTPAAGADASASASPSSGTSQQAGAIAKDGQTMPLEGEASAETAMSGQDAQSQQAGAETAAGGQAGADMTAAAGTDDAGFQDAIDRAEAALASGDEAACMTAVEEAKELKSQVQ